MAESATLELDGFVVEVRLVRDNFGTVVLVADGANGARIEGQPTLHLDVTSSFIY